jgi:SAM-dependent methyltransferase
MPLIYYSVAADREFWSEHWRGQTLADLLAIAKRSPLTDLIVHALPADGFLFEGCCGLGQYVVLLRARGHRALGADWSHDALRACRHLHRDAPLSVMDLRRLAVRSGSLSAYISLGVVEHDPAGPDGILSEAHRVLRPGGVLLLSVPYVNGMRRLFAPYLAWQNRRIHASGGQFYQFAFTRREVNAFLELHGFSVRSFHPYDPARMLRHAIKRSDGGQRPNAAKPSCAPLRDSPVGLRHGLRRLLYTPLALRLFGHMIMAIAIRR